MELGIAYSFTGHDGSRFVVGNGDAARADPDWVGFLDPENGITGLLDGAEPRANVAAIAQGHGVQIGRTLRGARDGTVQGTLEPNATLARVEGIHVPKIKRVMLAAQEADAIMRWTPSYDGIARRLRVRHVGGRPDVRGRTPKTFLLALTSPDPFIQSDALQSLELATGVFGQVTNQGDAPAWPTFRVDGPANRPLFFNYHVPDGWTHTKATFPALIAGEYLLVIPERLQLLRGSKTLHEFRPPDEGDEPGYNPIAGWSGTGGAVLSNNAAIGRNAPGSLEVTSPYAGYAAASMSVQRGSSYQVVGWVRSATGATVRLYVGGEVHQIVTTGAWQRLRVTYTAPVSGTVLVIFQNMTITSQTWQIDDVEWDLTPVDVSGFFDRSLPGPFQLPRGLSFVQWDSTGTTSATPLARVFWRHAWP